MTVYVIQNQSFFLFLGHGMKIPLKILFKLSDFGKIPFTCLCLFEYSCSWVSDISKSSAWFSNFWKNHVCMIWLKENQFVWLWLWKKKYCSPVSDSTTLLCQRVSSADSSENSCFCLSGFVKPYSLVSDFRENLVHTRLRLW